MPSVADILESWFIVCICLTIWCIVVLLVAQLCGTNRKIEDLERERSARD